MSKTSSILNVFQIRYTRFSRSKSKKNWNLTIVKHCTNSKSVSWKDGRRVCSPDTAVKAAGGEPPFRYNCTTIVIVDEKILTFCQQENKVLSKTVDGWGVQVIKVIKSNFISYLVQRNLDFRPLFCVLNLWTGKASLPLYHILQTSSGLSLDCSESVTDFEFQSIFRALQICRTYVSLLF